MNYEPIIDFSDELQIALRKAVGRRITGFGKPGSGKTTTMRVAAGGWLGGGLPATIIDPLRQFRVFKDHYPVIIAGRWKEALAALPLQCP